MKIISIIVVLCFALISKAQVNGKIRDIYDATHFAFEEDIIYLSSYEGKLKKGEGVTHRFLLSQSVEYVVVQLFVINDTIVFEHTSTVGKDKGNYQFFKVKNEEFDKVKYYLILGYKSKETK